MTTVPVAHGDPPSRSTAQWRDGKRYAWLLGLVVPTLPFLTYGLVELTAWDGLWFFGPFLLFVIFPLLDLLVGTDAANPPDSVIKWLEQDRYYRWCTYAFLPVQYAGLVFACWLWSHGDLGTTDSLGLALTMGLVSGTAINTALELGH
jgi:alkane 1-monooxygenase